MPDIMCANEGCPRSLGCGRTRFNSTAVFPQEWAMYDPDDVMGCRHFIEPNTFRSIGEVAAAALAVIAAARQ